MKTIVVGLGNPILGDDGVGWRVAEQIKNHLPVNTPVDVECLSLGGIGLMEHLIGYDRAIVVDAFAMDAPPGSVEVLKLSELPNYSAYHITSAHDTSLQKALELGRDLGVQLPDEITIIGIATDRIHEFSEDLSLPVEQMVPGVVNIVLDLLNESVHEQK